MSGPTAIRLAAVLAAGYALWVLLGGPVHLGAGGNAMTVRVSMTHAVSWLIGLLALVLAFGLWTRFAWAWWLALLAALVQGWRVVATHVVHGGAFRVPGIATLALLLILLVFIVLLFMPKARATCNR